MYIFGAAQRGERAVWAPPQESMANTVVDDPTGMDDQEAAEYGVDWDDIETPRWFNHHMQENGHVREEDYGTDPFQARAPETLSHVLVPDVRCPFSAAGVTALDNYILTLPFRKNTNPQSLQQLWVLTLSQAGPISRAHPVS